MLRVTVKLYKILEQKQRRVVFFLLLLMIVGGFIESLSVSLLLPLMSAVMDEHNWNVTWYSVIICNIFHVENHREYIQILLILLAGVFVVKGVYILGEYYIQYSFIANGRLKMQENLMKSYTQKKYDFYLHANSGEIVRIITADTVQAFGLLTASLTFYTELIISIFLGLTVCVVSPLLASGLFIILFIELWLIAKGIKPIMERLGRRVRKEAAISNSWFLQAISGIKSIKVSQTEAFFNRMYCQHASQTVDADRKQQILNNVPRVILESMTVAAALGLVYVQVAVGINLAGIIPQLSAFVIAAMRLLPSMNRISTSLNQVPFLEGGLNNIIEVLEEEPSIVNHEKSYEDWNVSGEVLDGSGSHITFLKTLTLDNITFSYPGTEKKILENANMVIYPGQSVGIVGFSGAGKTTTVDILLGLLKPQKGSVLVDGINIEENLSAWLEKLSYIPQKIFLMDSTIRENVAFGIKKSEIDDAKVWKSLYEAQLEEYVRALPNGLDSRVGEGGIRLSGGQCQRIGIARALYRDPAILFFDEATSSLDNETEAAIMKSIENLKGRRTLVIVAHRLTTIANCDVVYRVDKGRIGVER